jgi:hypothetical protein
VENPPELATVYQFAEFAASPATGMVFAAALSLTAFPIALQFWQPLIARPQEHGLLRAWRGLIARAVLVEERA